MPGMPHWIAETSAAHQQFPDDEECPALGEDLGRFGNGAEPVVAAHAATVHPGLDEVQILYFTHLDGGRKMPRERKEADMTTNAVTAGGASLSAENIQALRTRVRGPF